MPHDARISNDEQARRFIARLDGETAVMEYQFKTPVIIFTHTEVPPALRGAGVVGQLVRAALQEAREMGWEVVPLCPFVASWIRRHPEFGELVPGRFRYLIRGDIPGRSDG
jgi:predicted GNAT family acetyltransferase